MTEHELRRQAVRYLERNFPGLWEKRHGSPMQRAGKWDLMLFWKGCHVEIELKKVGGYLTRSQISWGLRAEQAEAVLFVCSSIAELMVPVTWIRTGWIENEPAHWRSRVAPKDKLFLAHLESTLKAA